MSKGSDAADAADKSTKRAIRIVSDNPLGLVLCGLAIGLVAGALAPVTDLERRKLAPIRDDIADLGKRVIEETASAATESASKHGQELVNHLQKDFGLDPEPISLKK
jgi:hypothetical protein